MNYKKLTKAELISKIKSLESCIENARCEEADPALLKSERKYRDFYDNAPDMFVSIDAKTSKILQCNLTLVAELGYSREEVIGQCITYLYHPDCEKTRKRAYKTFAKTGKVHNIELQLKRKDGGKIDVILSISSARDDQGKVLHSRSVWRDITERKKAENKNKRSNESLEKLVFERTKKLKEYNRKLLNEITRHELAKEWSKTILRTALDCFWIVDIQGRILEVNDAYCNLTGYSREELLEMCVSDVDALEKHEEIKKRMQQVIKTGSDLFESKHRCKDGRIINIEVSTNYMIMRGGCFFCFIRDITKKKESESILQEQKKALEQKNIALSEILGQLEIEKKQIKDNVIANAEKLLLPIIQKLRLKGESRKYVQLLQKNLQELTSSFGRKLTERESRLTSREVEICNMIKNGITSKEIADLLNISLGTTEKHRNNIRKKLDIVNKDINLSSVLKTL